MPRNEPQPIAEPRTRAGIPYSKTRNVVEPPKSSAHAAISCFGCDPPTDYYGHAAWANHHCIRPSKPRPTDDTPA